jgi:hydroxymethylglutaryl-CoA synthase
MLEQLGVSAGTYYESVRGLFFHRPYHLMPVQAMSFLYVRGLARGDHRQAELEALCAEAGVTPAAVLTETESRPDLYATVLSGSSDVDPYAATSAVASLLRKKASFRELLTAKMSLGSQAAQQLGNLYSAALPAWIAAGLEDAAGKQQALAGAPMVAVGYGSGDAAEALPISPVPGFEAAARRIAFASALEQAVDLSQSQYESLHDRRELDLSYQPASEFVISRVGTAYDSAFQDLGVEYYEYVA